MSDEPSPIVKLHRYHAAAATSRVDFGHPINMTWRTDGKHPLPVKGAVAYRLALCWNVMEGVPDGVIESGMIRDLFVAVRAGDLAMAQELAAKIDDGSDMTDGRPHDCKGCLMGDAEPDAQLADGAGR